MGQGGINTVQKTGDRPAIRKFVITDEEINTTMAALTTLPSVERVYHAELIDAEGVVHAAIDKTMYIKRKAVIAGDNLM